MLRKVLILASAIVVISFAVACGNDDTAGTSSPTSQAGAQSTVDPNVYANPQLLAETGWLNGKLTDKSVVVVDLRKKEAYDNGHIPGAVWYDSGKLKDPDDKLYVIRDSLFARYAGEIGVDNTKTVVAYDDNSGLNATRFWWVLWYYGDDNGKVLNGGWQKWQKEALPVSKEAPPAQTAVFKASANDKVLCKIDHLKQVSSKADPNIVILDARSPAEYTGADVRAAKGGHVPRAVNLDWTRSMTQGESVVWKPASELRKQFEQAGLKQGAEVITYCQTGVRAAHSLFTLRLLGYNNVRNYDGSWQEWGNNKDTAIER